MKKPIDQILIIFGASGDLTKRKLIPALFELYIQNLLPENFAVLGVSRSVFSDEEFRLKMDEFLPANDKAIKFKSLLFYQSLAVVERKEYGKLDQRLNEISKNLNIQQNYIFYLSTPPSM